MKKYDFTETGGFPLTQDRLAFMQEAYTELIGAIAAAAGDITGPMVISGMEVTEPTPGDVAVANGWFVYNDELIKFTGSTVTPGVGEVALVLITETATTLPFYSGATPGVQLEKTATLMAAATLTDATHFPVADMALFGREGAYTEQNFSGFGVPVATGAVLFKKDFLSNCLVIYGIIAAENPEGTDALPHPTYYTCTTLPVGYRPLGGAHIVATTTSIPVTTPVLMDFTNTQYLTQLNVRILSTGEVQVEWIKVAGSGALLHQIYFQAVVPLDFVV